MHRLKPGGRKNGDWQSSCGCSLFTRFFFECLSYFYNHLINIPQGTSQPLYSQMISRSFSGGSLSSMTLSGCTSLYTLPIPRLQGSAWFSEDSTQEYFISATYLYVLNHNPAIKLEKVGFWYNYSTRTLLNTVSFHQEIPNHLHYFLSYCQPIIYWIETMPSSHTISALKCQYKTTLLKSG